ncbi:ABC-2 type transport system ATP-binding protein [Chitinophaga ginsengisegetis]|uniref:ABC-2 type transport system ATP-binding protein n=1 Tax=Chitinophaga ginsengisegetis TaxID=393003 RepID=A0A1T5NH11_9BACT|nr:ATP-binding cassette domain-containing protein [Chitinophaga ginsengisegetis]MDR6569586.1 ABC-2 type transport system ATP-binding protein [Chitinophaga ginsengisegetis]MDR6649319.1 ABC-2 type transport system ATP-binding protein [Chitinophaga ginsengisegetis]MDR6655669.1 ABC-2 type transport system ATP-binding protein [Chitinophaga ginsengisegetis]SKC99831.1 ABC-2 type transport system ATP-binding protein [Chitinophaga ginsengisegetis]
MENAIVKVENLSHRYASQWAVRDINFEIHSQGVVGLLGSNGAGKSTTMNIICGVLKQSKGEVFINGINLKEDPVTAKRNIGFMPQKLPLYLDFTVEEYLTYCADLRMVEKDQVKKAVQQALERCGVAHFRERLLRNLSGGYQQRVGIAQAIVHNPKFVVLDEPTNGLDPNQIVEVRNLIKEIATDRSVLLSTHILTEVQATCKEIKMIEEGQMVFSGTLEMFDNYIEPNSLVVMLETPPAQEELLKLEGIRSIEQLAPSRFRLGYDGEKKTAQRIAEISVGRGWGLMELIIEKSSLDAVFARLSKKNTK